MYTFGAPCHLLWVLGFNMVVTPLDIEVLTFLQLGDVVLWYVAGVAVAAMVLTWCIIMGRHLMVNAIFLLIIFVVCFLVMYGLSVGGSCVTRG
jgi:hypothetical protein